MEPHTSLSNPSLCPPRKAPPMFVEMEGGKLLLSEGVAPFNLRLLEPRLLPQTRSPQGSAVSPQIRVLRSWLFSQVRAPKGRAMSVPSFPHV